MGATLRWLAFSDIRIYMQPSIPDIPKVKRGRPSTGGRRQGVMVRFESADLEALDAWITTQKPPMSRPDAIRQLVARGLEHG